MTFVKKPENLPIVSSITIGCAMTMAEEWLNMLGIII